MNTTSGFTVNTLHQAQEIERDKMSVILKQRTCRNDDWKALPDGHVDATFLVGPEGGKITDETAVALGLVDGWIEGSAGAKEAKKHHDKEAKGPRADKTGRRKAKGGSPLAKPKEKPELLADAIGAMMKEIENVRAEEGDNAADEVSKKLFTNDKLPDSRVLASRLEDNVSAAERDEAWLEFQLANPDMNFDDEEESGGGEGSEKGGVENDMQEGSNDTTEGGDDII